MGLSLVNGVFNEDFNYGYPYGHAVGSSPPEFEYSGTATLDGTNFKSVKYDRSHFVLQYKDKSSEPSNYDAGLHGGSHSNNFYYLLFPILSWKQVQVLTLKVHNSKAGTLSFDWSFDGYYLDAFYVGVNGKTLKHSSNSAGHGWTTYTVGIGKGWNTIQFVLSCSAYYVQTLHGGVAQPPSKSPKVNRYLRMTSINITNVDQLADGPHSYTVMSPKATWDASANLDAVGQANWTPHASVVEGVPSGALYWTGQFTFDPSWLTDHGAGSAYLVAASTWSANGKVLQLHEATDGGMEMGTNGALTIKVPIDTPQTIADRTRLLQTIYWDYPETAFRIVNGKLIIPKYTHTQQSMISTAHTFHYNDPYDPTSSQHLLRHAATYRWVATDVPGPDDTAINVWNEHTTPNNPPWLSAYDYEPEVHPHEHFSEEGLDITTYSRVVRTYWRTVQHMWTDLGALPTGPHYTWQIVGIVHPFTKTHRQHILDNGLASPNEDDNIADDTSVSISEPVTGRCGFGFWEKGVMMWDSSVGHSRFQNAPIVTHRPQVLTIVYGDTWGAWGIGSGNVTVYQHGHKLFHRTKLDLPVSTDPHFVLGRWHGQIYRDFASHMSIMEIAFYDRDLGPAEIDDNAKYLMGVYHFGKYR